MFQQAAVGRVAAHQAAGSACWADPAQSLADRWGIEPVGTYVSAGGHIVDFRYGILDPEKSAAVAARQVKPYLIHQDSGAKLCVPTSAKIGPLRQTTMKPTRGRIYFVLFANPGGLVKTGNKVSVVMGDCRVEDLLVQ